MKCRSQHLAILLADWMSGVTLQAVFYGKSQFDIREKVKHGPIVSLLFVVLFAVVKLVGSTSHDPQQSLKKCIHKFRW